MKLAWLAAAISVLSACSVAVAEPVGPGLEYTIDPDVTHTLLDGALTIEQYHKADANDDLIWQAWVRAKDFKGQGDIAQAGAGLSSLA
jgi:hypothetical protein